MLASTKCTALRDKRILVKREIVMDCSKWRSLILGKSFDLRDIGGLRGK